MESYQGCFAREQEDHSCLWFWNGESRAIKACEDALSGYRSAAGIAVSPKRVVFRAVGPGNLLLKEVNDAREMIEGSLCAASEVVFGVARDDGLKDEVRIVILAV